MSYSPLNSSLTLGQVTADTTLDGMAHLIPSTLIQYYQEAIQPITQHEPVILSIGENWEEPPKFLLEALRNVPSVVHGYQLSMYGLPRLRQALKSFLHQSYQLESHHLQVDYEVAVTSAGTRCLVSLVGGKD
jgi:aspartate/methionine/tyrosine aminotransferase